LDSSGDNMRPLIHLFAYGGYFQINADYNGFWGGVRYPPKEAAVKRLCSQLL
jgi:hypothetical protein